MLSPSLRKKGNLYFFKKKEKYPYRSFSSIAVSLSTKMSNICLDDLQSKQIEKMTRRSWGIFLPTHTSKFLRMFAFKINILEIIVFFCLQLNISETAAPIELYFPGITFNRYGMVLGYFPDIHRHPIEAGGIASSISYT